MNIKFNKRIIKRLAETSLSLFLITTSLTGCANEVPNQIILEKVDIDDEDVFITYDNLDLYKWYILKYSNGNYRMTRSTTWDIISEDITIYYFIDVFDGYDVKGKIIYNKYDKNYCVLVGEEIESAISVKEYVNNIGFLQDKYTQADMQYIMDKAIRDYDKNSSNTKKVYIKENLKGLY